MPAVTSIIAGVSAAAGLASGAAAIAGSTGSNKAPTPVPLTGDQATVAGQLASSFNNFSGQGGPVTGKPSLGQGLTGGPLNSPQSMRERLASVGTDLNALMQRNPTQTSNTPPKPAL